MKPLSAQKALVHLTRIKHDLRLTVVRDYEHRAKDCLTCDTPGACCLDDQFVNVRISRLEAIKINDHLRSLPLTQREPVLARIRHAIGKYGLSTAADAVEQKFSCPLFDLAEGCLVHSVGKPVPCIVHACYDDVSDLPPDELGSRAELALDRLNERLYRRSEPLLPLPLALMEWNS